MHGTIDAQQEASQRKLRFVECEFARDAFRQLCQTREQCAGRQYCAHVLSLMPAEFFPASPSARSTSPVRIMYQNSRMPGSAANVVSR